MLLRMEIAIGSAQIKNTIDAFYKPFLGLFPLRNIDAVSLRHSVRCTDR